MWGRNDKRKGRPLIRPRDQWVWSAEPTHEPIVCRELFDAGRGASADERARLEGWDAARGPQTPNGPRLNASTRCADAFAAACADTAWRAHISSGTNWYRCQYVYRRGPAAAILADHPKVLGIKEDKLLEPILDFLSRRVFGADRLRLLRDELAASTASSWEEHDAEANAPRGRAREDQALRSGLRRCG